MCVIEYCIIILYSTVSKVNAALSLIWICWCNSLSSINASLYLVCNTVTCISIDYRASSPASQGQAERVYWGMWCPPWWNHRCWFQCSGLCSKERQLPILVPWYLFSSAPQLQFLQILHICKQHIISGPFKLHHKRLMYSQWVIHTMSYTLVTIVILNCHMILHFDSDNLPFVGAVLAADKLHKNYIHKYSGRNRTAWRLCLLIFLRTGGAPQSLRYRKTRMLMRMKDNDKVISTAL